MGRRPPSPEASHRRGQYKVRRRADNDQNRRIVFLRDRRADDGVVDDVAIDLALRGWTNYAIALSRPELREAVCVGLTRGMTTLRLAHALCVYEREVQRFRAELRAATDNQEQEMQAA